MQGAEGPWATFDAAVEGEATLRDGSHIWIRPVSPEDRIRLSAFLAQISDKSLENRFFAPVPRDRAIEEILQARPGDDRLSLVALDRRGEDAAILAHAEFVATGPDPSTAEIAFLVRDHDRGRGLGTLLLHRLAAVARARGLTRFCAYVLPTNDSMIEVFRNSGFPVAESLVNGVLRVFLPISEPPDPPDLGLPVRPAHA